MLLAILIITWVASIAWHFSKGHILLGLFLLLSGLYECTGPILYSDIFGDELIQAQQIFQARATDEIVTSFAGALLLFLLLVNASYILLPEFLLPKAYSHRGTQRKDTLEIFYLIIFFVFVSGLISTYAGAGTARLMDYAGEALATTPFFTYGSTLLVAVIAVAIFFATHRKWGGLLMIGVAVAPLIHEILLTSKRQYFAPSVLLIILLILYSKQVKAKFWLALAFMIATMGFFGVQFWLRNEFTEGASAIGVFDGTVAPQLGEFVAIGSTTLYAWQGIVLGNDPATAGLHWLFIALNSIPYLRIGDLFFADYGRNLLATYYILAPWGGLSMLADAILGFGFMGVVFFALLAGSFTRYCHALLQRYLSNGIELTVGGVYAITMISTIVSKYRSGLGDALQSSIYLTILYFFVILAGLLLRRDRIDP